MVRVEYRLCQRGIEFTPVVDSLVQWGQLYKTHHEAVYPHTRELKE